MTVLYFTATGNGLYLAKSIGGSLVSIPKAVKERKYHYSDDKIGIVFPIYGGAVPQYIREFLQNVKLDSPYIFAVLSYGMFAGGAASHLLDVASESGIRFSYINIIRMTDNYLPGFKMEDQAEMEPKKEIDQHIDAIVADITGSKVWIRKDSFLLKFITKRMLKVDGFKTGAGATKQFRVEDTCTHCGICAQVCPTDNIQVNDAGPIFGNTCLTCLACTQNCPQNAIRMTSEKSKMRFRNQHIKLHEIIDANK